jgi:ferredoxin-nitrate reductase
VEVRRDRAGALHLAGDPAHPSSRGMLCSKGQALHHVAGDTTDRLRYPKMRRSRAHPLTRVDWDTALGRVAKVFRAVMDRHGPEAVGLYVSGQCLTEEYYVANKLMKGFIGCNNIDTNSRLCMSSAVAGYKMTLGDDAFPLSYDDIELGDCFFIAGANPAWCHPILFRRLEAYKHARPETKIIVVDPRRTQTCALADLHLQIAPGTDVAAYNAIARVLIENDALDHDFLRDHAEGFEAAREAAMRHTVEEAAEICDVRAEDLRQAAAWIGEAKGFQTWWAMGLNQSSMGVDKNLALINLNLLTGQVGKPGAGPFSLTGQPNAMGGREVGGMANLLAAHHDLGNADHREKVARFWGGTAISPKPGLTATEMFDALADGRMRAVWIICTNPAVSLPNAKHVDAALRKAPFVVVQDISRRAETVDYADVVLPAAGWLEKTGTMTNTERRVSLCEKLIDPPGEALPDTEILCRFAEKMGWGDHFRYPDTAAVFDEHAALTRGTAIDVSGITHDRLRAEGTLQWPCPSADHPGTPRLFEDGRFLTANGRARLHGVAFEITSEPLSPDFPLVLTTGRLRDQWHTMTRTGKVRKLRQQYDAPFVEVHPDDAKRLGLEDGRPARVASERASMTARVRVTDAIKRGVVFVPMHFSRAFHGSAARANQLTSGRIDPKSKEPDFKYSAVSVTPVAFTARRIVIVGGGAAALQFVQAMRRQGSRDGITVLAGERDGFYNRIQLPDYISGHKSWRELVTCDAEHLETLNLDFRAGVKVTAIDRETRTVRDDTGTTWPYDVVVIATGGRAALPPGAPVDLDGVFTLRSRPDAEAIRTAAAAGGRAVIVGGGLLGIELAGSLREMDVPVTLLHRSARLMGAQLDDRASRLLTEELLDRGIDVRLNEQIRHVHGEEKVLGVRLSTGDYLDCGVLVYAIGTRPNDELALAAGLTHGAGVTVDNHLRTSDPNIYAIGEVAEHASRRHGTTLAAQQQADVAAAHLMGDHATAYAGTLPLNILKVAGLSLAAIGLTSPPTGQEKDYETVSLMDDAQRTYLKCVVKANRLVGAILLGDTSLMPQLRALIESGTELDADRLKLLRPGAEAQAAPPKGRIVCSCNRVGEGNLRDAIRAGKTTAEDLCAATNAGSGCGSCRPEVAQLLERVLTAEETPPEIPQCAEV